MTFWIWFWTGLLWLSLLAFAGLAIVVAVGGFFEVRGLLQGAPNDDAE